jgi:hypothetical protein
MTMTVVIAAERLAQLQLAELREIFTGMFSVNQSLAGIVPSGKF